MLSDNALTVMAAKLVVTIPEVRDLLDDMEESDPAGLKAMLEEAGLHNEALSYAVAAQAQIDARAKREAAYAKRAEKKARKTAEKPAVEPSEKVAVVETAPAVVEEAPITVKVTKTAKKKANVAEKAVEVKPAAPKPMTRDEMLDAQARALISGDYQAIFEEVANAIAAEIDPQIVKYEEAQAIKRRWNDMKEVIKRARAMFLAELGPTFAMIDAKIDDCRRAGISDSSDIVRKLRSTKAALRAREDAVVAPLQEQMDAFKPTADEAFAYCRTIDGADKDQNGANHSGNTPARK